MPGNKLIFQSAEKARDAVQVAQQKKIAALYEKWAKEIKAKAAEFGNKESPSAAVSEIQMRELESMLKKSGYKVTQEVNGIIVSSLYSTANAVVTANNEWLESLGFNGKDISIAFNNVPTTVVQNLVTGQVYKGGWNLSKAIWGDNSKTLEAIYEVVAAGVAQNMPIYEIAKLLEQYVNPSSAKPWNLKTPDGKMIYKRKVDYNAQRLARTLVQHSYQQSFITTTKENPLVSDYIWDANGSRVCEICKARNGKHFPKDRLPMDHPNGMCVMVPNTPSYNDMADQLAAWAKGEKENPAIDRFAKKLGYKDLSIKAQIVQNVATGAIANKVAEAFGTKFNSPIAFKHKMTDDQYKEWMSLVKEVKAETNYPGNTLLLMEDYANGKIGSIKLDTFFENVLGKDTMAVDNSPAAVGMITSGTEFAAKYGTSSGAKFDYWYSKLDPEAKEIAKKLKDESGQTWQQWYEANIYKAKPGTTKKQVSAKLDQEQVKQDNTVNDPPTIDTSSWIERIKKQTESYMLSTEAENFAKMTDKQTKGIMRYTGSAYEEMNGYLRYRAGGMSHKDAMEMVHMSDYRYQQILNAIDGIKTVASNEEFVLRRGTDIGDLAGLMQGDFADNKNKIKNLSAKELNDMFMGHIGTYAGFTSTSSIWDRGFDGSIEVVIRAPIGTQGTSVMTISQYGTDEGEFLLNAGTRVQVIKVEESDGHMGSKIRVWMDIIGVEDIKKK